MPQDDDQDAGEALRVALLELNEVRQRGAPGSAAGEGDPSIRRLAGVVGVGRTSISNWLKGSVPGNLDQLLRMVGAVRAGARARGDLDPELAQRLSDEYWVGLYDRYRPAQDAESAPESVTVPRPVRQRLGRRVVVPAAIAAVVAVTAVGAVVWPRDTHSSADAKSPTAGPGTRGTDTASDAAPLGGAAAQSPTGAAEPKGPLFHTTQWPSIKYCDGSTSVAMPVGGPALSSFPLKNQDFRSLVTNAGGASWGNGHLYLDLSAEGDKTVTIDEIRPATRVPTRIEPPAWVAETRGGCGGVGGRIFTFDLDEPKLEDKGVVEEGAGSATPDGPATRANPLGPGFTVSARDPATVRIDVTACRANYEWSLFVDYTYAGRKYHQSVGPFRSMGTPGRETVGYAPDPVTGNAGEPGPPPVKGVGCR